MQRAALLAAAALIVAEATALAGDKPSPAAVKRAREKADDMMLEDSEEQPQLALRFYDAVSGAPIPGATVTLEGQSAATDGEGRAIFDFPKVREDNDKKTAIFSRDGYITSKVVLDFQAGTIFINRFSISRKLPLDQVRIVLDWGNDPPDLDAHLVRRGQYHISYRHTKQLKDLAWLDRDDQDGQGPETITVSRLDKKGEYAFMVHDYTHRDDRSFGSFARSKARVAVFANDELAYQLIVPDGPGRVWHVLSISGGDIKIVNAMSDDIPER